MTLDIFSFFLGLCVTMFGAAMYHAGLYAGRKREPPVENPVEKEKARRELEALKQFADYSENNVYGDGL